MSSETTVQFPVGTRVRVAADADDVYFGGEVEGVVVENEVPADIDAGYRSEQRVNVRARDEFGMLFNQYVRPQDLTRIPKEGK